jgi:hypothetical protein
MGLRPGFDYEVRLPDRDEVLRIEVPSDQRALLRLRQVSFSKSAE